MSNTESWLRTKKWKFQIPQWFKKTKFQIPVKISNSVIKDMTVHAIKFWLLLHLLFLLLSEETTQRSGESQGAGFHWFSIQIYPVFTEWQSSVSVCMSCRLAWLVSVWAGVIISKTWRSFSRWWRHLIIDACASHCLLETLRILNKQYYQTRWDTTMRPHVSMRTYKVSHY
jgi:hypothetical protein